MYLAAGGQAPRFSGAAVRIALQGTVLCRPGCLLAQQRRDREGGLLERGIVSPLAAPPGRRSSTAPSRRRRSPRRIAAWFTSPRRGSRRPTGCATARTLIYNSGGRIFRIPAAGGEPEADRHRLRHALQQRPRGLARRNACWRSATSRRGAGNRSFTHCRSPAARPGSSPRPAHRTGTAGRPTARPWPSAASATASSTSTPFRPTAAPRPGSRRPRAWTTARSIRPTARSIYFNSVRTGTMQIWRMKPDGSEQEQVTSDEFNNWFPHLSPDGRSMVFLSYEKDVTGHPAEQGCDACE